MRSFVFEWEGAWCSAAGWEGSGSQGVLWSLPSSSAAAAAASVKTELLQGWMPMVV